MRSREGSARSEKMQQNHQQPPPYPATCSLIDTSIGTNKLHLLVQFFSSSNSGISNQGEVACIFSTLFPFIPGHCTLNAHKLYGYVLGSRLNAEYLVGAFRMVSLFISESLSPSLLPCIDSKIRDALSTASRASLLDQALIAFK